LLVLFCATLTLANFLRKKMKPEFELENFRKFVRYSDGKALQTLLSLLSETHEFTDRQFAICLRQEMGMYHMIEQKKKTDSVLSSGE
jgi:hypothetical protein